MVLITVSVAVIAGLIIVIIASKFLTHKPQFPPNVLNLCQDMVVKSSQAAAIAHQDSSLLIAFQHSSEALCSATLARNILGADNVQKLSGINVDALISMLSQQRDEILRLIATKNPDLIPRSPTLPSTNWIMTPGNTANTPTPLPPAPTPIKK